MDSDNVSNVLREVVLHLSVPSLRAKKGQNGYLVRNGSSRIWVVN